MAPTGHSVLVVPVPELEPFVRARWHHYDSAWVSHDPAFVHAHITVLAPFRADPTPSDLARVAEIAGTTDPFPFALDEVDEFPNGLLHVRPDPDAPFIELTRRLWAAFPDCPPYGGAFEVAPHLTLDQRSSSVSRASTSAAVADLIPTMARADRLELQWYEAGRCHVRSSWPMSGQPAKADHDAERDVA